MNLSKVYHGVASPSHYSKRKTGDNIANADLFNGIQDGFMAGRYHSWVIDPDGFPGSLEITATDAYGPHYGTPT